MKVFIVLALVFSPLIFAQEESASPEVSIAGRYTLSKTENFYEYLTERGVGWFTRQLAVAATPITTISKDADEYTMKTETTFTTTEIKFKLGEEFDEVTGDGSRCRSTITMSGLNMHHVQRCGEQQWIIDREFSPNQMKMLLFAGDVTSTRIYTKG